MYPLCGASDMKRCTALDAYGALVSPRRRWVPKSFQEIQLLYVKEAIESGLWLMLHSKAYIFDFGLGTVQDSLVPFTRGPAGRYVVDAEASEVVWSYTSKHAALKIKREAFLGSTTKGFLCEEGTYTIPSYVRSLVRLRAMGPSSGESRYGSQTFDKLLDRGLLDSNGYVEVGNVGGPLGSAVTVKTRNSYARPYVDNIQGAQQVLWCHGARGGNLAIRCEKGRTLVALNKVDAAIRLLMAHRSHNEAIVYFVEQVCGQSTRELALDHRFDSWTTFVTRFVDTMKPSLGQRHYQILGNHGSPTIWESVTRSAGLRSLTNPLRALDDYTMSDVAQVFVQVLCTPNFMTSTDDRWASLAALQHYQLLPFAETVIGHGLGRFGTDESGGVVDLVQCLFEYDGDAFHPVLAYAWWRYVTYTDETFREKKLTASPPPVPRTVSTVTGPFYVMGDDGAWEGESLMTSFVPGTAPSPSSVPYTLDVPVSLGKVQINVNYFIHTLRQMLFPPAPLCPDNVNGGRWPFLGTYNVQTGKIEDITTPRLGPALGRLFSGDIVVGRGLPASLPNTIGRSQSPFLFPYFIVTGADTPGVNPRASDTLAPLPPASGGIINDGWIYYDSAAHEWRYQTRWQLSTYVAVDDVTDTVVNASCLWDRTTPSTTLGHISIYTIMG